MKPNHRLFLIACAALLAIHIISRFISGYVAIYLLLFLQFMVFFVSGYMATRSNRLKLRAGIYFVALLAVANIVLSYAGRGVLQLSIGGYFARFGAQILSLVILSAVYGALSGLIGGSIAIFTQKQSRPV